MNNKEKNNQNKKEVNLEIKKLKEFIDFMNENNICELEIEEEGKRIKLKKFTNETPLPVSSSFTQEIKPQQEIKKEKEIGKNTIEIKSPMVGTFYRAPSPGAKPFVEVGDIIKEGDVVCIIEAMKLMNEIKTETSGKILEILVENGQPVEFGQPLFILEPSK